MKKCNSICTDKNKKEQVSRLYEIDAYSNDVTPLSKKDSKLKRIVCKPIKTCKNIDIRKSISPTIKNNISQSTLSIIESRIARKIVKSNI